MKAMISIKKITLLNLVLALSVAAWGQKERKVIREGVRAYGEGDFSEAEVQFRKAEDINQESFEAEFNTGTALYGQEKYEETVKQYESLINSGSEESLDPENLAHIWHNMGNSLLEAQQYEPSIEAYKNSLRLKPDDYDTKYNLAYAMQKLKEQQQQQQQQQQEQEQQDKEDQEDQDQQDGEQQEGDQDQQEGEQQEGEQDRQEGEQEEQEAEQQEGEQESAEPEEQDQPQEAQAPEISKEDAERMLNAIQQQEKEVKDKVDKKKAATAKVKTKKDW